MGQNIKKMYKAILAIDTSVINGRKYIRGDVTSESIPLNPSTAKRLNENPYITGMTYELIEDNKEKTSERITLEKEANDLNVKFRENIGDEKLQEKINKVKEI